MDYTVARVAMAYHRGFWDVAGWPWADVLVAEAALDEVERVGAIRQKREQIEAAQLQRIAMWDERGLAPVERAWEQALAVPETGPVDQDARAKWLQAFRQAEAKGRWKPA